jgi:uncharacterized protein (DUF927 family)
MTALHDSKGADAAKGEPALELSALSLAHLTDTTCAWALAYGAAGMKVFPVSANETPLTPHGHLDATSDPATIRSWWGKWPHADIGWALPKEVVALDLDESGNRRGLRDFEALASVGADTVETPQASTPTGGRHLFHSANGRAYKNWVKPIAGKGIDTRTLGGYVVLPGPGNGRKWLKPLSIPLAPVPDWVPEAKAQDDPEPRESRPFQSESEYGRAMLAWAIRSIIEAPDGEQAVTLNHRCYTIGGLIAGGVLDYGPTLEALTEAALQMPTYGKPWGDLRKTVERSTAEGMKRPLLDPAEVERQLDETNRRWASGEFDHLLSDEAPNAAPRDEAPKAEPPKDARRGAARLYRKAPGFRMDEQGLFQTVQKKKKGEVVETFEVRRSDPFEVISWASDPKDNNPTLVLRFRGRRDIEKVYLFECTDIHTGRTEMARRLTFSGLQIAPNAQARDAVADYLSYQQQTVSQVAVAVKTTGWHNIEGNCVFVLPHEVIGPPTSREVYLQTDEASRYSVSGTLADWKREIGNSVSPHTLLVFGICAAFAGPLLMPAGVVGLGVHFYGKSSLGKTTLLQCATSVWSSGSESGKYLTNWQSTPNALEILAMLASDTTLPVDEMSAGDPDKVFEIVYRILNGVGRSRLNANASLREIPTWRVTVISTGEKSMKEKLAERGRKALAGQEVRLINVPVGDNGVLIDHDKPGEVIDRLKAAAGTFYGTAGPAFVRRLTSDPNRYKPEEIRRRAHAIRAGWVTQDASPEVGRAAWSFAVVALAGELAIEFGIVDWAPGAAQAAAKAVFDSWVEERGGQATSASDEDLRATLRKTVLAEAARFTNVEDLRDARGQEIELRASGKRLGFVKGRGKERKWLFSYDTWNEVFGGEQRGAAAIKLFAADGFLDADSDDRTLKRHRVGKTNLRYVTVNSTIAAGEDDPILYDRPVGFSSF